jgi:fructose-1,6-bisphosphatase
MKKINKYIILLFISLFCLSCYGDFTYKNITKKEATKWLNNKEPIALLRNSIICSTPEKLAKVYNYIVARGGMYNKYNFNMNWPGCFITNFWYPVHIIKKLYHDKIIQIDYLSTTKSSSSDTDKPNIIKIKWSYILYSGNYVLSQQLVDKKRYQQEYISN